MNIKNIALITLILAPHIIADPIKTSDIIIHKNIDPITWAIIIGGKAPKPKKLTKQELMYQTINNIQKKYNF